MLLLPLQVTLGSIWLLFRMFSPHLLLIYAKSVQATRNPLIDDVIIITFRHKNLLVTPVIYKTTDLVSVPPSPFIGRFHRFNGQRRLKEQSWACF